MRKILVSIVFLFSALILFSSPCYEDVETAAFSTILARSSIPTLSLMGVTFIGDDDEIIPDRIIYESSDLSTYLESLNTKPEGMPFWKIPLYTLTQNGATMKKTKKKLADAGYEKGDVVITGTVDITSSSPVNKIDYITRGSLSSINMTCDSDLIVKKDGEEYILNGVFTIKGDESGTLSVVSDDLTVNGELYNVDVKYRKEKE